MNHRYVPPEWVRQKTVWLSFPHNISEWNQVDSDNPLKEIQGFYRQLIEKILDYQNVDLLFAKDCLVDHVWLNSLAARRFRLKSHVIENNDIWIRDYGPFFVKDSAGTKILNFEFNAWGGKFPPWNLDNDVSEKLSSLIAYPKEDHDIILEGGAVEFNGDGVLMTTKQCLLNPNRNLHLSQWQIEAKLKQVFNLQEIIWLERGLEGDHTDGHIDDFARFISADKILLCQTSDKRNPNYQHLQDSAKHLERLGYELEYLPLPRAMKRSGEYLPASYANFIFLNGAVVIPLFGCDQDMETHEIFRRCFPDQDIVSIDSSLLIQEGGGLHCMTKHEAV